ncbi:48_t:CDS:2, partial [Ambispora leptoticha]
MSPKNIEIQTFTASQLLFSLVMIILLLVCQLPDLCESKITIFHESENTIISTIENVDFPWINSTSYGVLEGYMVIANFSDYPNNPCRIRPMHSKEPDGRVTLLAVPFEIAWSNGCHSYADFLTSNDWLIKSESDDRQNTSTETGNSIMTTHKSVTNTIKPTNNVTETFNGSILPTTRTSTQNPTTTNGSK